MERRKGWKDPPLADTHPTLLTHPLHDDGPIGLRLDRLPIFSLAHTGACVLGSSAGPVPDDGNGPHEEHADCEHAKKEQSAGLLWNDVKCCVHTALYGHSRHLNAEAVTNYGALSGTTTASTFSECIRRTTFSIVSRLAS